MAPKPTGSMSVSLETCLDEVPEETRLWKPERAPQATETNIRGKRYWPLAASFAKVALLATMGAVMVALPWTASAKMPNTAQTIMVTIMMVVR